MVFPLAVGDDSATGEEDENAWADNAWNAEAVTALSQPAGFWLTGGDQMRITQTLVDSEKGESGLLRLMRERLAAGAFIGGSSAGAAVMSANMIAGGTCFKALLQPVAEHYESIEDQDSGRLYTTRGHDLVDNHWSQQLRRLKVDGDGRMLEYTFSEIDNSQDYWLRHSDGSRYTIANVRFDIGAR